MVDIEIIPLNRNVFTPNVISQILGRNCVVIDEYSETKLEPTDDIYLKKALSLKIEGIESIYYLTLTQYEEIYMSAFECLEDINVFALDTVAIAKLWKEISFIRFEISSNVRGLYSQDTVYMELVATLTEYFAGVITVDCYDPKIPEYLFTAEEWRKLIQSFSQ